LRGEQALAVPKNRSSRFRIGTYVVSYNGSRKTLSLALSPSLGLRTSLNLRPLFGGVGVCPSRRQRVSFCVDMPLTRFRELIPVLQEAIGPVILISGVGLLLLTLTNRFGRAVDRSRQLAKDMKEASEPDRHRLARQIEILYRRAGLIRISITMAAVSLLLTAVLIISLFVAALLKLEAGLLISFLFICCLLALVVSLAAFIKDIHLSLVALKLELGY